MAVRIALLGAYGSGKTTLAAAIERELGIPAVQAAGPMRVDLDDEGEQVHEWSPTQLIGLTVARYADRRVAENRETFVSDGSVLHEFVYAALRLRDGSYPGTARRPDRAQLAPADLPAVLPLLWAPFPAVRRYADQAYTLLVHLPAEVPLAADPPIDDDFRARTDAVLTDLCADLGRPVHVVTGTVEQRLDHIARLVETTPQRGATT
ncbi:AAA family ATPase [Actinokineospora globicatena]|uniref:AAA family ATPase n=1 Tax=Actinokineospora globicatena TaxID=103729 RepID=UPI0020A5D9A8|nr:AAA family ATPase [Actinokineospora globicatena]MCP2303445.1 AAA domain-containing protein [Actinokineospora globicatena]